MAEKTEEHVADKYYRLKKKVGLIIETTNRHHRKVYDEALEKHLMENGQVNMDLLDREDKQKAFARQMSDSYISLAQKQYNIKPQKDKDGKDKPFDEAEKAMIVRLIGGTTYDTLYRTVRQRGKGFTFDHFNQEVRPKLMENLESNLSSVPVEHLNETHPGEIIKYVEKKSGKSIDFINKDALRLQDAIGILDQYETLGQVTEKPFEKTHYYIPKGKRKKAA